MGEFFSPHLLPFKSTFSRKHMWPESTWLTHLQYFEMLPVLLIYITSLG